MSKFSVVLRPLSLLLAAGLLMPVADAQAQRVSARDRDKVAVLETRMAAAEKRYTDALALVDAADPKGQAEADAALEDMEDVLNDCVGQRGCQLGNLLASYKRLLKGQVDAGDGSDDELGIATGPVLADPDHVAPLVADVPEAARAAQLLNDHRHAFDEMVEYNPAVQAGIRRWLTDMRPALAADQL